ncbi:MAG: methanogenesis marker 14 protein [Candidatus Thorarchaeota archaeon]|nr:methanogenesis marker 14 protein [Candidatus Thorarchaeota archaeon]
MRGGLVNFQFIRPRSIGVSSLRGKPYYTVASVELGNTTTKCILMTTNLQTAEVFELAKEVRMTRSVRPPRVGEQVFGKTLVGVELTREAVTDLVRDVILAAVASARIDLKTDVHFVVRSTGVTAGFSTPEEVDELVRALAEGCLQAGAPTRSMTAAMSEDALPPSLRDYTWLRKVYFDGAIASSLPPSTTEIVANEMEGELVTAGIKGAVKGSGMDFRNPVMTLDFGTTLAGRVTDNSYPYARTIGSFAGLAGAIPDAIVRGSGLVSREDGCALDLPNTPSTFRVAVDSEWVESAERMIRVEPVPVGVNRFGTVPVNPKAAAEAGVTMIGVDVGTDGSDLCRLEELGAAIMAEHDSRYLLAVVDLVQTATVQRIVTLASQNGLVMQDTSLGITGRAATTGRKPELIAGSLRLPDGTKWTDSHQLVFVEDGLAIGAAVAARCMNSMGTVEHPMGGRRGDRCIMAARMKLQSDRQSGTRHDAGSDA